MLVISFLLFFVCLILLPVGLISPSLISKIFRRTLTRKQIALIFIAGMIVFLILMVKFTPPANKTTLSTPTPQVQEQKVNFVYDIPSLVGKNIDEVRTVLGQPLDKDPEPTQQQIDLGGDEWYNTYKNGGKELVVTFRSKDRKIIDFFIGADTGITKDKKHLLELGNLSDSSTAYKIEYVKAIKDPSSFTGVKVIPQ